MGKNILKYCAVIYFVLKKKTVQPVACAALLHPLCFSRPMGNEQKHLAKNKTAQFLNMFNDTTHQNVY